MHTKYIEPVQNEFFGQYHTKSDTASSIKKMDTFPLYCAKRKKGYWSHLNEPPLNLLHFEFLIGTKLKTIPSQLTFQLNQLQKRVIQLSSGFIAFPVGNSSGSEQNMTLLALHSTGSSDSL